MRRRRPRLRGAVAQVRQAVARWAEGGRPGRWVWGCSLWRGGAYATARTCLSASAGAPPCSSTSSAAAAGCSAAAGTVRSPAAAASVLSDRRDTADILAARSGAARARPAATEQARLHPRSSRRRFLHSLLLFISSLLGEHARPRGLLGWPGSPPGTWLDVLVLSHPLTGVALALTGVTNWSHYCAPVARMQAGLHTIHIMLHKASW